MKVKQFWDRVKILSKTKNITQETIAKNCGISFSTLRGWMTKNYWPPINDAAGIAKCLGVSLDYLYYGKEISIPLLLENIQKQMKTIEKSLEGIEHV